MSGDRDLLQIADQHIMIRIPKTKMGRTEIEDYYPEDVVKTYQVTPLQFIDLKALLGDSSDNVPGVPKVGQKTATELMVQYGSMDNIYAHVEEISKKSIRESLIANRELADLSKALVTIKIDSDVSIDYEAAKAEGLYTKEAYSLFKELEFKNMLGRFEADSAASGSSLEDIRKTFRREGSQKAFLARCRKIKNGQRLGLFLAWEGGRLLGAALAERASGRVLLLRAEEGSPALTDALAAAGVPYDDIAVYRTIYDNPRSLALREELEAGRFDYVTFTSASTVKGFVSAIGEDADFSRFTGLCIGKQTAGEAEKHHISVKTAGKATIDALVELALEK